MNFFDAFSLFHIAVKLSINDAMITLSAIEEDSLVKNDLLFIGVNPFKNGCLFLQQR